MTTPNGDGATAVAARTSWWQAHGQEITLGTLLLASFWPILWSMFGSWFDEAASMEHGILVIPAAICMAWAKRAQLSDIPRQPSFYGVLLIGVGTGQAIVGSLARWTWISRMAFLVSLAGGILALYGYRMLRASAYPLLTLVLMVTPPTFLYERFTLDLQLWSSKIGEYWLDALGYSVLREGNVLELVGIKLSVEEACSGIRSLFSISFFCVVYGYFFAKGRILRVLIVLCAVPMAIVGNAARIVMTGVVSQYNRALVEGASHQLAGYLSVATSAAGCVVFHILAVMARRVWRTRHA